jgi:thymidylate synthase (FAD)
MNKTYVGEGSVQLIAGGGKIYTDIAARFTRSEKSLDEIISSPYDSELVKKIVDSGHKAAVEFDYFIFGVEGYSRVTETQLVRKRLASYLIKSGRPNKSGKRSFDVAIPKSIESCITKVFIHDDYFYVSPSDILSIIEQWYNSGIEQGYKEEELRYIKPQATEFKAIIGMNAHSLMDWFQVRCCQNAQTEIRDMANKMLKLCKEVAPDIFENAGASCKVLGYCPENNMQNKVCQNRIVTKNEALEILSQYEKVNTEDR